MLCHADLKIFFQSPAFLFRAGFVREQYVQQIQRAALGIIPRFPKTEHNRRQQIVVGLLLLRAADEAFLRDAVPGNGIFSVFRRVHADPNGVYLLNLLIMAFRKLRAVLGGDQPAAVVQRTLDQGITGIKIVLRLHIHNQADKLPRDGGGRRKADVIGNGSFPQGSVLAAHTVNSGNFILRYRFLPHLGRPFNILLGNLVYAALPVFFQAAFHNPGQNDFFGQQALAHGVITGLLLLYAVQLLCQSAFCVHPPHLPLSLPAAPHRSRRLLPFFIL